MTVLLDLYNLIKTVKPLCHFTSEISFYIQIYSGR